MNQTLTETARVSYPFDADRTAEEQRLIAQARVFDPLTEPLLREAGIGHGMHVVDLGSGAGDTALLASRLVGPSGSVLGLDRSAESVALARRRITDAGITNISFREADVTCLDTELAGYSGIDAVMGRLILMWVPDPVEVVRACAQAVGPGGLLCFVETDVDVDLAVPSSPTWDTVGGWLTAAVDLVGARMRMSTELDRCFRAAGLPAPRLAGRATMFGAAQAPTHLWVNVIRGLLPALEAAGIVDAAGADIDTLETRLRTELADADAVMIIPTFTAAWARVPG
ncbi:MAG: class I SAM-dependent methyltransferase [Sporichthyaceae bacterium]